MKLVNIARNLGHETPRAVTRGNLKTDRDAEVYRDLYGMITGEISLMEKMCKWML